MPPILESRIDEIVEARSLFVRERPITFDEFFDLYGPSDDVELIDGVAQKRMAAELDHERLFVFVLTLIQMQAQSNQLGAVFGSRTAVRISQFRGRLPDVLFVRQENVSKLEQKGLRFAPDLVIEILSPGDRLSDQVSLETDYRNIGVPEIIFIDQRQRTVRVLRKQVGGSAEATYDEQILRMGDSLRLDALGGVLLPTDWLFLDSPPTVPAAFAIWQSGANGG